LKISTLLQLSWSQKAEYSVDMVEDKELDKRRPEKKKLQDVGAR
jgi:hypothetical protein